MSGLSEIPNLSLSLSKLKSPPLPGLAAPNVIVPHDNLRVIGSLIRQSMSHDEPDSPFRRVLTGDEVSRSGLKAQLPDGRLEELRASGLLVESGQRIFSPFRVAACKKI